MKKILLLISLIPLFVIANTTFESNHVTYMVTPTTKPLDSSLHSRKNLTFYKEKVINLNTQMQGIITNNINVTLTPSANPGDIAKKTDTRLIIYIKDTSFALFNVPEDKNVFIVNRQLQQIPEVMSSDIEVTEDKNSIQ